MTTESTIEMMEIDGHSVPKWGAYQDETPHRERECAVYVRDHDRDRWQYVNRGRCSEVIPALVPRYGWTGGLSDLPPEDLRVVLDCPPTWMKRDRCTLTWDGPMLTLRQFKAWLDAPRYPETSHGPEDYGEGAPECPDCEGEGTADGVSDCGTCGGRGRMGTP